MLGRGGAGAGSSSAGATTYYEIRGQRSVLVTVLGLVGGARGGRHRSVKCVCDCLLLLAPLVRTPSALHCVYLDWVGGQAIQNPF